MIFKFKKQFLVSSIASAFVFSASYGSNSEILARHQGGAVLRHDLKIAAEYLIGGGRARSVTEQQEIVKAIAVNRELARRVSREKIAADDRMNFWLANLRRLIFRKMIIKQWRDEHRNSPLFVYHARQLIVPHTRSATEKSADRPPEEKDNPHEKADTVRAEAIQGSKFNEIVKKNPEIQAVDAGFIVCAAGRCAPDMELAIRRLSGEITGTVYRSKVATLNVLGAPEEQAHTVAALPEFALVVAPPQEKSKIVRGWTEILYAPGKYGFVRNVDLEHLGSEGNLSFPLKRDVGWHVVELLGVNRLSFSDYAKFLEKTNALDAKTAQVRAAEIAEADFQRTIAEKEVSLFTKFGLESTGAVLPVDWKEKTILLETDRLSISTADFRMYITKLLEQEGLNAKGLSAYERWESDRFRAFILEHLYAIAGAQLKFDGSADFRDAYRMGEEAALADLYRNIKWPVPSDVTDADIKTEIQKRETEERAGPVADRESIVTYILSRRKEALYQDRNAAVLLQISLKFEENHFRDGEL